MNEESTIDNRQTASAAPTELAPIIDVPRQVSMTQLVCCVARDPAAAPVAGALEAVARACSPRVDVRGDDRVIFDASGLGRVLGPPEVIGAEVMRLAADRGLRTRVAMTGTAIASSLLASARPGVTVASPGDEAAALAPLPLEWLATNAVTFAVVQTPAPDRPGHDKARDPKRRGRSGHFRLAPGPQPESETRREWGGHRSEFDVHRSKLIRILHSWGLSTLGDLARLPRGDLHARLGPAGVRLHQAACGEDAVPIVPTAEAVRFVERIELEWPIDGLEPLSFVLARLCDSLSAALDRADRGAVTITTMLRLTTRAVHTRALHLPAPMKDARVLRTLILLDLESHPPPAAIDVVDLEVGVTPGRILHGALFARTLPSPEDLATLVARLGALMGDTRVGAPVEVDTDDSRAIAMQPFTLPAESRSRTPPPLPSLAAAERRLPALRRYRLPIAASVSLDAGRPAAVSASARVLTGGRVTASAGPWRSSGAWWSLEQRNWDRDEWDVQLADGHVYRLAHDRQTGRWVVEGTVD